MQLAAEEVTMVTRDDGARFNGRDLALIEHAIREQIGSFSRARCLAQLLRLGDGTAETSKMAELRGLLGRLNRFQWR
jgi:hypothetical protein